MAINAVRQEPESERIDSAYFAAPDGVYLPCRAVKHRDFEYAESGFDVLQQMQEKHFWYRGRHRFLRHAVTDELRRRTMEGKPRPSAIDLGGGCGGWLHYIADCHANRFEELALGDSSRDALRHAAGVVPRGSRRYQIDLLDLQWQDRWDMVFLLDVLEHIPDHDKAMSEIRKCLRPGGVAFVATPALKFFWSYNDDLAHHVRRYNRGDFRVLAQRCGFRLRDCRYFMFFLSPLLYLSRLRSPDVKRMSSDEIQRLVHKTHRIPTGPVNAVLGWAFRAETPIGHWIRFPWGTSILGVFEKE